MNLGPQREALNEAFNEHKEWIESYLGDTRENLVVHKSSASIVPSIGYSLFKAITGNSSSIANKQMEEIISKEIFDIEFAPGSSWNFDLESRYSGRKILAVDLGWDNVTSVVRFAIPKANLKLVFINVSYATGPAAESEVNSSFLLTTKQDSDKLREYARQIIDEINKNTYTIWTYDSDNTGSMTISGSTGLQQKWENLVLDESIIRLVKRDVISFLERKDWFVKNSIPFRRGYLLHGPPGNGKTSVVKTMLSVLGMNAYTIRLFSPHVSDETLEKMFRDAQLTGPNMVILEDLDRAFPKTGERKSPIGLHTLLNCLDGLESQEGVITVATANDPTILDKAILKRPGRFDRVILFDNPTPDLREAFFIKKADYLGREDLSSAVDSTEGFSFAQLQEVYVMAGQNAYERGSEVITVADLHQCAAELRGTTNNMTGRFEKVGYK